MRRELSAALAAIVLATTANAESARFELDPEHTAIGFVIEHVGFAGTLGVFRNVSGGFTYDAETQELSDVEITVETGSVDTFNEARDNHVKGKDFLDVGEYPAMVFTADGGTPASATSGTVTGELSILGQSRPLTLDVTLNKAAEYPFGHKRFVLGLTVRGTVKRSDYGMEYAIDNGLVGDDVTLLIETEAMRIE